MKKKFLILILFTISGTFGFTQPLILEWQNCFGGPRHEKAFDLVSTGNGYIILVSHYTESQERNIQLLKTDTGGNVIWEKSLGGTLFDEPCRIFSAGNSNYFITSVSASYDGDISNDPYPMALNYWTLKIDSAGEILWEKIHGGTCIDQGNFGTSTSDGGVIAYGYTCSADGDITNNYGAVDAWMVKLDSIGNKVWDFSIGNDNGDFSGALIETTDKGILATAGSYQANGGNIECQYFSIYTDIVLFKLDSVANEEWQQCYGGSDDEWINSIVETDDGYLLLGVAHSDDGDVAGAGYHLGYENNGIHTSDIWLIKIDFAGNILWSKCYGGTRSEFSDRVFKTSDGGFIVFGETESFDGDVSGNHSAGPNWSDIWILKLNQTGDLIWQQCIGGQGNERLISGVVDNGDGSYVIASTIFGENSGQVTCQNLYDNEQIWLIKVTDTTVGINEKPINENAIIVYPNPANEYVVFESSIITKGIISVSDIYGRAVAQIPVTAEKTVWDARGVKPGVYVYHLQMPDKSAGGKLIITP